MSDLEERIEECKEDLQLLRDSDLPCAWIADRLLDSVEGDSSYSSSEPTEPDTEPSIESQNPPEPEGSIFAY